MHDVDRTQLEHSEMEDEILRKVFGKVARWLRRQPSAPALPPPGSVFRPNPADPLVQQIQAARAELRGMLEEQAGAGGVAHLYEPMIREQRGRIAQLEEQLRRFQTGR